MRKVFVYLLNLFFTLIVTTYSSTAQLNQVNLVVNPSIEIIDSCPSYWGGGDIQLAFGWDTLRNGDGSTPDIFNVCYTHSNKRYAVPDNYWGIQYPKYGNSYAGLVGANINLEYREYMQGILTQQLVEGNLYCVKTYVNLANRSEYSCVSLGIYLDDGQIKADVYNNYQLPNVTPQILNTTQQLDDTLNWMKIEGSFIADGTEEYITIGNFFPVSLSGMVHSYPSSPSPFPSQTCNCAYYYIDDVSVIDISTPAYAGNDTVIHPGDSVFIGRQPEVGLNEACIWFVNGIPTDTVAGLWVTPTATTTYILQQTLCGNISYDTVTVTMDFEVGMAAPPSGVRGLFNLYPNPNDGNMTLEYSLEAKETGSLILYDMAGKIISRYNLDNATSTLLLNEDSMKNGVYFYSIIVDGSIIETNRIVIIK